ncbi:MAG: solute:sodium symporter family transporter, partial [Bacteroidota bacterium]
PMATVILAGFFFPKVSAVGAKVGLAFGLFFYILLYFILEVDLHFVHIWGLEFLLNIIIMHLVSMIYPRVNKFQITDVGVVDMVQWKYAKAVSIFLVVATLVIYILLGTI